MQPAVPTVMSTRHEEESTCALGHTLTVPRPATSRLAAGALATTHRARRRCLVAAAPAQPRPGRDQISSRSTTSTVASRPHASGRGRMRRSLARAVDADPRGEPEHGLRRRRRPHRRIDVRVVHPAGQSRRSMTLNDAGLEVERRRATTSSTRAGTTSTVGRVAGRLADWEYIAANVYEESTGRDRPRRDVGQGRSDGVKVGFIGAVTEELPSLVSPAGIAEDIDGHATSSTASTRVADTPDGRRATPTNLEADVLVLLIHEGAANTSHAAATDSATPFGRIVNGVSPKIERDRLGSHPPRLQPPGPVRGRHRPRVRSSRPGSTARSSATC